MFISAALQRGCTVCGDVGERWPVGERGGHICDIVRQRILCVERPVQRQDQVISDALRHLVPEDLQWPDPQMHIERQLQLNSE